MSHITFDGLYPGWTGHVQEYVAITPSDSTIYDPPLRLVHVVTNGTIIFTLSGDSTTDVSKKVTRTMKAGDVLDQYAIQKIWAASTATFQGFR